MPKIDDPRGSMSGLRAIDVDVSGLDRFAGSVDGEVEGSLRPQAGDLLRLYQVGSHFGVGHSSAEVVAARSAHTECLQAAADQLAGYVNAAKVLVEAAREVAARYRDSDAFAAASADEVQSALNAVVVAAAAEQPPQHVERRGGPV